MRVFLLISGVQLGYQSTLSPQAAFPFSVCKNRSSLLYCTLRLLSVYICHVGVLTQQVSGLVKGAAYHVRVSAYNGVALSYGKTRPSTPPVVYPGDIPAAPSRVEVEAASSSSLTISWAPPNDVMGVDVLTYKVVRNSVCPCLLVDDQNGQMHIVFIGPMG